MFDEFSYRGRVAGRTHVTISRWWRLTEAAKVDGPTIDFGAEVFH
jgi:hypothetical protein